ncbi:unnamed protein product, partial [Cladocopium goreaui]
MKAQTEELQKSWGPVAHHVAALINSLVLLHDVVLALCMLPRGLRIWIQGDVPKGVTIAGVELLVTSVQPLRLAVDSSSVLVPVPVCDQPALYRILDLCCGLGGFTVAAERLGFGVRAGVDQNPLWRKLFESFHPSASFIPGDLTDPFVLQQLLQLGAFHGVVCSGIACQPHSILGDRRGMNDPRSDSLPKTLVVSWMMQAAVLILECTPEILRDPAAQEMLRQYAIDTGYRMAQGIVKLGNAWCSRRDRWIAVLTAPVVHPCEIVDLPVLDSIRVVADLIPEFRIWHQFEQAQLTLNLYELSKYYQYAAGGMNAVWIKMDEKLPTLLHSAGNQLYTCACGCRAALSETRLQQRGLIGTLLKLGTSQVHMHTCMEHARYLHPLEMWALLGGMPTVSMGHNLRLAMAGVGQAVAPLMGLWIFAHVKRCLDLTMESSSPCDPMQELKAYMTEVTASCREMWPLPVAPTVIEASADASAAEAVPDPIEDDVEASITCVITHPCTDEPDLSCRVASSATGAQLLAAEVSLGSAVPGSQSRVDGLPCDPAKPLHDGALVSVVSPSWDPAQLKADQYLPCCFDSTEVVQQALPSGVDLPVGSVTGRDQLADLRWPDMKRIERQNLLGMQGPVWGDDEIMHGLLQIAVLTVIGLFRGGAMGVWKSHSTGFVPEGHCGAMVLSFIRHVLWGHPLVLDQAALSAFAAQVRFEFSDGLPEPCQRPRLAGLGVNVQTRLAQLLVQHGVADVDSLARATLVLKALGEEGVTRALDAGNPWKELKWLGNQLRPPYMLIKPSELQAQVEKRAADKPVGNKRHKQPKGKGKGDRPGNSVDPTLLRLEHGIFQSDEGQLLGQLTLPQVGSSAAGVVVLSANCVEPYLRAPHVVSTGPLAFFVVDSDGVFNTSFPVSAERVPLVCAANSEPLLVDGHLIQLGARKVIRAPAQVVAHPLQHVFGLIPPLQACSDVECGGCEAWHRTPSLPMDTPVLELWGKQWLRMDFAHCPPEKAEMFSAHIRLPEQLQLQVQQFSGHSGVYLEPKALDGRKPSPEFQVVWVPKLDVSQLMVQRQTIPHVVGMARLGNKYGLRCLTEHAAEVFVKLRPGHTFLPPGRRQTYLVGPFAFGTLQASVAQALLSSGWTAKPIQAVAAKSHVQGLMFRVQSVQDPPMKVLRMAHGDVMIAREDDPTQPTRVEPKVVATTATESFVSKACEVDYIQKHDPWAKAASKLPAKAQAFQIGNPLEDVTQKVLAEVMAQMPRHQMEVDADDAVDGRVTRLEQQVQELAGQAQTLVAASQQQASDNAKQFQEIRTQVHQQGTQFEAAISNQAATIQTFQDAFQEQFRQQVSHQQTMLDNMFNKQMNQFETLLAKRPRMLGLSLPVQCWVFSILDDVVWLVPLVLWILAGLLSEIPLVCGHAGHVIGASVSMRSGSSCRSLGCASAWGPCEPFSWSGSTVAFYGFVVCVLLWLGGLLPGSGLGLVVDWLGDGAIGLPQDSWCVGPGGLLWPLASWISGHFVSFGGVWTLTLGHLASGHREEPTGDPDDRPPKGAGAKKRRFQIGLNEDREFPLGILVYSMAVVFHDFALVIGQGGRAPSPARQRTDTGTHTGVMFLSKYPARALPHTFDKAVYDSARIQVVGMSVAETWVTIGLLYGIPENAHHNQARYQTDAFLAELVDRVGCQTTGPRVIGGDFNFGPSELQQLDRLHALGFREVQDLAAWRYGISAQATGRGSRRIDQMWISPELQMAFQGVQVSFDHWADHAAVCASFSGPDLSSVVTSWAVPRPFPWPKEWTCQVNFDPTGNLTEEYAKFWCQVETQAKCWNQHHGVFVTKKQCGRAAVLETTTTREPCCPVKKARKGDVQPTYMGTSLEHARYFRQLRRLQSLCRALQRGPTSLAGRCNRDETWRAIRRAVGFPGGFGLWWNVHGLVPALVAPLPLICPPLDFLQGLFLGFQSFVQVYERDLARQRYQHAKHRRANNLAFVFQDCKDDPLPKADTLIDRVEVHVEEVREDDSSVVLTQSASFLDSLPLVSEGKVVQVVAHHEDQVWLESTDGLCAGSVLSQERPVTSDTAILQRFAEAWGPRWVKQSHVQPGQWTQICGFLDRVLHPIPWEHKPWTLDTLTMAIRQKKSKAAKGPDGVSQPDLASLPPTAVGVLVQLLEQVESGKAWPAQLANGFVTSLAKRPDAQQVDQFRSTCGLPEGCALSVFGMVVVDWVLDLWISALDVKVCLRTFVDDWGLLFPDAGVFHRVWTSVEAFTEQMDLALDLTKTRIWSTHADARKQFREGPLEVTLSQRNLGAHQNFSRHCHNAEVQKRLEGMPKIWVRLRASQGPYNHKISAIHMMAWPRALHGISVVHLGDGHFRTLRSGAMRALKSDRKGANPTLHLATSSLLTDPEAWAVVQTVRDARDLGDYSKLESLLGLFAQPDHGLPSNGPTAVLFSRLTRLGWGIGGHGLVQDRFGCFSLLSVGWDELFLRIKLAWGHVLSQAVAHRSTFAGIENADLTELQHALKGFGPVDQVYLRCHLDGTLFTQNGRAKFAPGVTSKCPWCPLKDGFHHRAWICPHFAACRDHLTPAQLEMVPTLPSCLRNHGWPVVLPEWDVFARFLLSDDGFCRMSPVIPPTLGTPEPVTLFLDGTTAHPKEPKLRYAAWAVTVVPGGPGTLDNRVLMGGHVVGLCQSPFRAELTAMVCAVRWAVQRGQLVHLWSDCQGVVKGVQKLLQKRPLKRNRPHSDLWMFLQDLLAGHGSSLVKVFKVVSHGQVALATGPLEEWAYWHNNLTDRAAEDINQRRSADFWVAWTGLVKAVNLHRAMHVAILQVLLRTCRMAAADQVPAPPPQVVIPE